MSVRKVYDFNDEAQSLLKLLQQRYGHSSDARTIDLALKTLRKISDAIDQKVPFEHRDAEGSIIVFKQEQSVMDEESLKLLAKDGERLYAEIKTRDTLHAGEWIAINCEQSSLAYGKYVHAPFPDEAADKHETAYGDDLMWLRQIDYAIRLTATRK